MSPPRALAKWFTVFDTAFPLFVTHTFSVSKMSVWRCDASGTASLFCFLLSASLYSAFRSQIRCCFLCRLLPDPSVLPQCLVIPWWFITLCINSLSQTRPHAPAKRDQVILSPHLQGLAHRRAQETHTFWLDDSPCWGLHKQAPYVYPFMVGRIMVPRTSGIPVPGTCDYGIHGKRDLTGVI